MTCRSQEAAAHKCRYVRRATVDLVRVLQPSKRMERNMKGQTTKLVGGTNSPMLGGRVVYAGRQA